MNNLIEAFFNELEKIAISGEVPRLKLPKTSSPPKPPSIKKAPGVSVKPPSFAAVKPPQIGG
jgi:hypothetical protein